MHEKWLRICLGESGTSSQVYKKLMLISLCGLISLQCRA